jgi:hypothetical protein
MSMRRWVVVSLAVVLVLLGLVVRFVGGPVLLRFPLSTDQKLQYRGSVAVGVNPATMVPFASPIRLPLKVDRTVRVTKGSYSQAVIDETIAATFAGSTRTETYQYVMDRRNMQLLNSPESFAFGDKHATMAVSGSFRINLPMGTSPVSAKVFAPEIDAVVTAVPTGPAHHAAVANTQVITFKVHFDKRVAPYYLAYLNRNGLPNTLSSSSLTAELQAHGVSAAGVLQAVTPYLTSSDVSALRAEFTGLRVPLVYRYFEQGQISVQTSTGAVVDAKSTHEGVSVAPDLSALRTITASLAHLQSLPVVQKLDSAVASMSAPRAIFDMTYAQTPASVRAVTATANSQATMIALIAWQLPLVLGAVGVVGLLVALLWRPRPPRTSATVHELPSQRVAPPATRAERPA